MIKLLAARGGSWEQISKHFGQESPNQSDATFWMVVLLVLLSMMLLGLMGLRYGMEIRDRLKPASLYMRVAKTLGLGFGDRWWLWRVAQAQELSSPLTLLMSPATLEYHVDNYLKAVSKSDARHLRQRFNAVRKRLFGEPT